MWDYNKRWTFTSLKSRKTEKREWAEKVVKKKKSRAKIFLYLARHKLTNTRS